VAGLQSGLWGCGEIKDDEDEYLSRLAWGSYEISYHNNEVAYYYPKVSMLLLVICEIFYDYSEASY
jgi:hypothetical protein